MLRVGFRGDGGQGAKRRGLRLLIVWDIARSGVSIVAGARVYGWGKMKTSKAACIAGAITFLAAAIIIAIYQTYSGSAPMVVLPTAAAEADHSAELPSALDLSARLGALSQSGPLLLHEEEAGIDSGEQDQAKLEENDSTFRNYFRDRSPAKRDLSYLGFYVYAEYPLAEKPADIVLDSLKDVAIGTPVEEIRRASDAFGLDFSFMKAVAKIESDFDPKQRTGSYIGLFQLSHYEFGKYGSGEITSARDNAIAAAYKFVTEATLFEWDTHRKPTSSDLYLIHQQGWQGAAEHVAHPERIAWKSMCATDEGREKGEKWCKRAVWGNTLPDIKEVWKTVDNLTSEAFVTMWRHRVDLLYARYAAANIGANSLDRPPTVRTTQRSEAKPRTKTAQHSQAKLRTKTAQHSQTKPRTKTAQHSQVKLKTTQHSEAKRCGKHPSRRPCRGSLAGGGERFPGPNLANTRAKRSTKLFDKRLVHFNLEAVAFENHNELGDLTIASEFMILDRSALDPRPAGAADVS
jgi:hypothetical protein